MTVVVYPSSWRGSVVAMAGGITFGGDLYSLVECCCQSAYVSQNGLGTYNNFFMNH